MTQGERVKQIRKELGLSLEKLAKGSDSEKVL